MSLFVDNLFDDIFAKSRNCNIFGSEDELFKPIAKVASIVISKPSEPKSLAGRIAQAVNIKGFDESSAMAAHDKASSVFASVNHVKLDKTSLTILDPASAYVIHTHDQEIGFGGFNKVKHATLVEKQKGEWVVTKVAMRKPHTQGSALTYSEGQALLKDVNLKCLDTPLYVFKPEGKTSEYALSPLAIGDMGSAEPEHLLKIARDVAQGLADLHESNLIHRDVKPANVLVYGESAKLSDLDDLLTPDGQHHPHIGTQGYVAPEVLNSQIEKNDDLFSIQSKASDAYALGVILMDVSHQLMKAELKDDDYNSYMKEEKSEGKLGYQLMSSMIEDAIYADMQSSEVVKELRSLGKQLVSTDPSARPSTSKVAALLNKLCQ
ncbi:MAG: protein kinase [Chlamydiia bacterium]|nr:protein kinase [Chlamydiia bacterium]